MSFQNNKMSEQLQKSSDALKELIGHYEELQKLYEKQASSDLSDAEKQMTKKDCVRTVLF